MKFISYAAAAAALCASVAVAQDVEKKQQFRIVVDSENQPGVARLLHLPHGDVHASKYWIGVMATPVSDTVKSQLRLETGLAVEQVVDKGPAKSAGVKQHDILLKFNDQALSDVGSLIKAVEESKGKKAELVLLRGGSEKKLKISATERPATDNAFTFDLKDNPGAWLFKAPHNRMMLFGPGMKLQPGQDLKDLNVELELLHDGEGDGKKKMSVTIKRENDKPATIIVKKNGETFEVTEKSLDKLPEDVRVIVKKHLEGNHQNTWRHLQWKRPEIRLDMPGVKFDREAFENRMQKMMQRMEKLLEEVDELKKDRRQAPRKQEEETVDA